MWTDASKPRFQHSGGTSMPPMLMSLKMPHECARQCCRRGSDGTIFVPTALGAVTLATLYEAFLTELAPARFRSFVEGGLTVCWGPDGHELCTRDGKKYDFEKHDLRRSSSVLSGWESE